MSTKVKIRTHPAATIRTLKELIAKQANLPGPLLPILFFCCEVAV
jgi:hypothetical protein